MYTFPLNVYSYETANTSSFCSLLKREIYPSELLTTYSSLSNFLAEVTFSKSVVFDKINWLVSTSFTRFTFLMLLLSIRFWNRLLDELSFGPEIPDPINGLPLARIFVPSAKSVNPIKFLKDSELFVLFNT